MALVSWLLVLVVGGILNAWGPHPCLDHLVLLTNGATSPGCHSGVLLVPMVLRALLMERCKILPLDTVVGDGCRRFVVSIPSTCMHVVMNISLVHCSCLLERASFANTTLHPGMPTPTSSVLCGGKNDHEFNIISYINKIPPIATWFHPFAPIIGVRSGP